MGFFDNLFPGRGDPFGAGNGMSHSIDLTRRRPTVSLTKQGAASGNLRVNLSWRMRTPDLEYRSRASGDLLRHPMRLFRPAEVPSHTQGLAKVDLDLGCLYELTDGSKGVVQPLGDLLGEINEPPYVKLSGDDRLGSGSGETIHVNLDHRDEIKRLLFFVYIYDQTPAFDRTQATVTLFPSNGPQIEIALDEHAPQARSCAVFMVENVKGELVVRREVRFVYGFQSELDRLYGWGMQWGQGFKSRT
ncbi:Tellurium resistance [Streptomyces sp. NPDC046203]|uniref:TerD family protein n=1 Tax=Streptomyces sp. NPDC046203 TaxID=3154602 RepID=UPI0034049621